MDPSHSHRNGMVYRLVGHGHHRGEGEALKVRMAELFNCLLNGGDLSSCQLSADDIRALLLEYGEALTCRR
jgi:hypothetical protein